MLLDCLVVLLVSHLKAKFSISVKCSYSSSVSGGERAHEGRAEDDGQLPEGVAAAPQLRQEL